MTLFQAADGVAIDLVKRKSQATVPPGKFNSGETRRTVTFLQPAASTPPAKVVYSRPRRRFLAGSDLFRPRLVLPSSDDDGIVGMSVTQLSKVACRLGAKWRVMTSGGDGNAVLSPVRRCVAWQRAHLIHSGIAL